jgi:hypothetical protein
MNIRLTETSSAYQGANHVLASTGQIAKGADAGLFLAGVEHHAIPRLSAQTNLINQPAPQTTA